MKAENNKQKKVSMYCSSFAPENVITTTDNTNSTSQNIGCFS